MKREEPPGKEEKERENLQKRVKVVERNKDGGVEFSGTPERHRKSMKREEPPVKEEKERGIRQKRITVAERNSDTSRFVTHC